MVKHTCLEAYCTKSVVEIKLYAKHDNVDDDDDDGDDAADDDNINIIIVSTIINRDLITTITAMLEGGNFKCNLNQSLGICKKVSDKNRLTQRRTHFSSLSIL